MIRNINLDELELETGDILLFNHVKNKTTPFQMFDNFLSWAISYWTNSPYTHIGIVVKDPDFIDKDGVHNNYKGLYLLESNYEGTPDSEDNQIKFGVQLILLEVAIQNNYSNIYYRKLDCKRDDKFFEKFNEIHTKIHNKPYDINPVDWIKAAFNVDVGNVEKTNTFWCSALVSYIYVNLGFLDKDLPWTIISPEQLSSNGANHLTFKNCTVEKEKLIYELTTNSSIN